MASKKRAREELAADLAEAFVRSERNKSARRTRAASEEILGLRRQLDAALGITSTRIRVRKVLPRAGERDVACALLCVGDWHYEEVCSSSSTHGLNSYDTEIANKRLANLWQNSVALIRKERSLAKIRHCVVAILGDLISGHIHEELSETNSLSPVEATLGVVEQLCGGLNFLLEHGGFDKITVMGVVGNHGRTTERRRVKNATKQSYEWMAYHTVKSRYANDKRIEFVIPDGLIGYLDVYGTKMRVTHGDMIRYAGGVGGVTIPLNKAIDAWNSSIPADYTVMGHWHELDYGKRHLINGSLIGWVEYSESIKARYSPPEQALCLIGSRGPTCFNRVFVD